MTKYRDIAFKFPLDIDAGTFCKNLAMLNAIIYMNIATLETDDRTGRLLARCRDEDLYRIAEFCKESPIKIDYAWMARRAERMEAGA